MLVAVTVHILTETEKRVALLAAAGHGDDEIAAELDLTPRVVAAHLSSVFRKLGVRSRADLMARLPD
jgi:DNA-binding CsgD family transcriptional regulator